MKGSVFSMTSGMIGTTALPHARLLAAARTDRLDDHPRTITVLMAGPGMTIIPYTFYCTGIVFGILLLIFGAWYP